MTTTENGSLVPDDAVLVVFGANGDLSRRKLIPSLYRLHLEGLLPKGWRLIGNSRSELGDEGFRDLAAQAVDEFGAGDKPDGEPWAAFAARLSYRAGVFDGDDHQHLRQAVEAAEREIGGSPLRLFYLSVPPAAFKPITEGLGASGLNDRARVVYEKPFGWDQVSFQELDRVVHEILGEEQIYRIDHFLGKETLQNVLAIRFANGMFEPVWNRQHIDHVQIDVPETLGVGTRASFYETTGALRDMVVTHLFQVLSVIALEPPVTFEPRPLMDEKLKVFESMAPIRCEDLVRGQYEGYRDEPGVAADSDTETFVALRCEVDNWRWAGVPFYLRTGKRMAERRQTVTLAFREPPGQMFRDVLIDGVSNDHLTLDLGSDEGLSLSFLAKVPGPRLQLGPARMTFSYSGAFKQRHLGPYERLLHDALLGDRTLFTRADGIERTWKIVHDILAAPPAVQPYAQGSWGPGAAMDLCAPHRWHLPEPVGAME